MNDYNPEMRAAFVASRDENEARARRDAPNKPAQIVGQVFTVDSGEGETWSLKIGARVISEDDQIGTVLHLRQPMTYENGQAVNCLPSHPDAVFYAACIKWEDGTQNTEKTTLLRPAEDHESEFYSAASLEGHTVKPREWLVEGLIPSRTVTLLGGDGGTGKSLLALQLAVAAASGGQWIANAVKSGPAIYLSAEDDDDELHRRLDDVLRATGCSYGDVSPLTLTSYAGKDALLTTQTAPAAPLQPSALYKRIDAHMAAVQPVLLVLDTLADLFGGNENDRVQARQFIGLLKGLAIKHCCAVVLLAHPSLSGLNSGSGTSGSTGWNNSVRSRLYFERVVDSNGKEDNFDARVLRTMKSNHAQKGGEIELIWRDGVFAIEGQESGLDRLARNAKAERVFLSLVRLYAEQGRPVNPERAHSDFEKDPASEGIKKNAFLKAKLSLLAQGKICHSEERRNGRARAILQVAI